MKENVTKCVISAIVAGITAYFRVLFIPMIILFMVMITDYATGMTKAWILKIINSRTGIIGIIKKLCYFVVVACAVVVDWMLSQGLYNFGVEYKGKYYISLLIVTWLIINELISILENVAAIGAPIPKPFVSFVKRLKSSSDTGLNILDNTTEEDK